MKIVAVVVGKTVVFFLMSRSEGGHICFFFVVIRGKRVFVRVFHPREINVMRVFFLCFFCVFFALLFSPN